jgi:uncharacterized radical SAM protein YgiQ
VGIIAQPRWDTLEDIKQLGKPRLMFAVSAGNMDSMVNHYTADRKRRRQDEYSPGGMTGKRPDRATLVYCNLIRQAFPGTPVIIGGVEASLRRLAHYDYWSDRVRRSIILDSRADLLVYGMGEDNLLQVAQRLHAGEGISSIHDLRGTCFVSQELPSGALELPSWEEVSMDKLAFARATRMILEENNPYQPRVLAQRYDKRWVVQNPPALPVTTEQLDRYYDLPFQRRAHPVYAQAGGVPALEPVQFSLQTHRGCFGGCAFCALGLHQGRFIQSRSRQSLAKEAQKLTSHPDFHGTIPDVGGPSANMYGLGGIEPSLCRRCRRGSCLYPASCKNMNADHAPSVSLWQNLRRIPGIKHIFVASGLRYDLLMEDKSGKYLEELCRHHVSGQLKVAPEHIARRVTGVMRKSGLQTYQRFVDRFNQVNRRLGKKQYIIPYFMTGHPGCGLAESVELAQFVHERLGHHPEQVQNFTPTPMTLSTCIYYTGIDPFSGEEVYVPREEKERRWQRALIQHRDPKQLELARSALHAAGRQDLIGNQPGCLIPPGPSNSARKKSAPNKTSYSETNRSPQKETKHNKRKSRKNMTKQ